MPTRLPTNWEVKEIHLIRSAGPKSGAHPPMSSPQWLHSYFLQGGIQQGQNDLVKSRPPLLHLAHFHSLNLPPWLRMRSRMLRKHKFFLILRPRDQTKLHIPSHIQILSQEVRRYAPRLPLPLVKVASSDHADHVSAPFV